MKPKFEEYDIVQVVNLLMPNDKRGNMGAEDIMRDPVIGDKGTIVHIHSAIEGLEQVYIVECCDKEGRPYWLADFLETELQLDNINEIDVKRMPTITDLLCPICSGYLEEQIVAPCYDCGHESSELTEFEKGNHAYSVFSLWGIELVLCDFCNADFDSYYPDYFGLSKDLPMSYPLEFIGEVKNLPHLQTSIVLTVSTD